jgi:putative oxidoreductase
MLGAIAMVHWPRWSFVPSETHPMGGMEFQVVLMLLGLFFALRGNRA